MKRMIAVAWLLAATAIACRGRLESEPAAISGGTTTTSAASGSGGGSAAAGSGGGSAGAGSGGSSAGASPWWEAASADSVTCLRHTASAVGPDKVLIVGSCTLGEASEPVNALLYDATARTFTPLYPHEPRSEHSAAILSDGRVAIAGDAVHVETFDPSSLDFELGPALVVARTEPMLIPLPGARLWVLGGFDGNTLASTIASTEIVDVNAGTATAAPPLLGGRARAAAALGSPGPAWIAGGESDMTGFTSQLGDSEHAVCGGFAAGPPLGLTGDVATVRGADGAVVFGYDALTWGDGLSFGPPIQYEKPLAFAAGAAAGSGRVFLAGIQAYLGKTHVLEATTASAQIIATRPALGSGVSIAPVGASTFLVFSGDPALLHVP
jgi:hypothetical protein